MTSFVRPDFEPWIESYLRKRFPELELPLLNAVRAYDAVEADLGVDPTLLKPLLEAASNARVPLYENATELLGALAVNHEAARQAVIEMASNSKAQVRFNAILCVNESAPRSFALQIVRNRLYDNSARVREKAADWAYRCRLNELVPDLTVALEQESSANAKSCIRFALDGLAPK
jgi:hypothetical protein